MISLLLLLSFAAAADAVGTCTRANTGNAANMFTYAGGCSSCLCPGAGGACTCLSEPGATVPAAYATSFNVQFPNNPLANRPITSTCFSYNVASYATSGQSSATDYSAEVWTCAPGSTSTTLSCTATQDATTFLVGPSCPSVPCPTTGGASSCFQYGSATPNTGTNSVCFIFDSGYGATQMAVAGTSGCIALYMQMCGVGTTCLACNTANCNTPAALTAGPTPTTTPAATASSPPPRRRPARRRRARRPARLPLRAPTRLPRRAQLGPADSTPAT
jgi:hypothetical protein